MYKIHECWYLVCNLFCAQETTVHLIKDSFFLKEKPLVWICWRLLLFRISFFFLSKRESPEKWKKSLQCGDFWMRKAENKSWKDPKCSKGVINVFDLKVDTWKGSSKVETFWLRFDKCGERESNPFLAFCTSDQSVAFTFLFLASFFGYC